MPNISISSRLQKVILYQVVNVQYPYDPSKMRRKKAQFGLIHKAASIAQAEGIINTIGHNTGDLSYLEARSLLP